MNRNKLIEVFSSNLANAVIHQILEKAIDKSEIAKRYSKEVKNSWGQPHTEIITYTVI